MARRKTAVEEETREDRRKRHLRNLRANLQALRQARGLTQHELAAQTGLQLRTYGSYEGATSMPPLDVACQIADALGTTADALLWEPRQE